MYYSLKEHISIDISIVPIASSETIDGSIVHGILRITIVESLG